jgi:pimeloyl-ACP methyl ester carboxylesterase
VKTVELTRNQSLPANVYEFPASAGADGNAPSPDPLVTLSYVNGFLPETYDQALRPLFKRHRVVSPHLRAMWQPPQTPATFQHWRQLADDLLAHLDKLTPNPVIGIGHSIGANTVMYVAAARPERFQRVVLMDPTLFPATVLQFIRFMRLIGRDARLPLVEGALKRGRHWDSVDAAYHYFRGKKLFERWSDDAVHIYTNSITAPDPAGGVRLVYPPEWEARFYQTVPTDIWQYPAKLKMPTLIVRGELTDVFSPASAARFARLNPAAKIVTIPGAGHLVAQEQPEAVGKAIADFVG